jgi:hypothetical protein
MRVVRASAGDAVVSHAFNVGLPEPGPHRVLTFEPPYRPVRDDPGLTAAPEAFAIVLRGIRRELQLS